MKHYRCYLLTSEGHIARAKILTGADDSDAARQARDVLAEMREYAAAEIWDGARKVYRCPEEPPSLLAGSRRRGDARAQDDAIADALSEHIARDRRAKLEADALKALRLREQRLQKEATANLPSVKPEGPDSSS